MTYNKPEIVKSAEAVNAIQGSSSKTLVQADNIPLGNQFSAPAAYEADE